jgi:AraC family transcriptional regulator
MYINSLPDHSKPGFDKKAHFELFKTHNVIVNAVTRKSYCKEHVGCLSFKTVLSGTEKYIVNGNLIAVKPGQFLILNHDQPYSSEIETNVDVRSVAFFFKPKFAASVVRDSQQLDVKLSDDCSDHEGQIPEFFQTLYHLQPNLMDYIAGMIYSMNDDGYYKSRADEFMMGLLRHLLLEHRLVMRQTRKITAVKFSTRKEIYRRLCVAKDVLHSSFRDDIDLDLVSQNAAISVPQLIRYFKQVFGVSPHQYLTAVRMQHAAALLLDNKSPLQEITWQCGFEDASSFCRLFKKYYGYSPFVYQKMHHSCT